MVQFCQNSQFLRKLIFNLLNLKLYTGIEIKYYTINYNYTINYYIHKYYFMYNNIFIDVVPVTL